jgi:hypothetical protein
MLAEIAKELATFHEQRGSFSRNVSPGLKKNARLYWQQYGYSAPLLQRLAVRVFSQPISASSCERNWSIFGWLLAQRRQKLKPETLTKMVKIKMEELVRYQAGDDECSIPPWITESVEVIDPADPEHILFGDSSEEHLEDESS